MENENVIMYLVVAGAVRQPLSLCIADLHSSRLPRYARNDKKELRWKPTGVLKKLINPMIL
jgi:hypothetical protein